MVPGTASGVATRRVSVLSVPRISVVGYVMSKNAAGSCSVAMPGPLLASPR